LAGALAHPLVTSCLAIGELPVDLLQFLFATADPLVVLRKFSRFAALPEDSAEALDFVALEDWVNDGVPLSLPVAVDCLAGWYGANTPARGLWEIAGAPILPSRITQPSLVVVPGQDRLVPPASAVALLTSLPRAESLAPPLGHLGMIVAREAPRRVWQPLAEWLRERAARRQ
jgi:polyhydroxyalkanoate synthase